MNFPYFFFLHIQVIPKNNGDQSRGEIVVNSVLKTMLITFFDKSRMIVRKNNGDHFGGQLLALFGDHFFCGCMTFFCLI